MLKVFIDVVGGLLILILYSCCKAASLYDYREETPPFMFRQVDEQDLNSMCEIGGVTEVKDVKEDVPTSVLIPAFIISELRTAFWIGFLIFVPFLVIDMVVSSTLMSMGMMMLPPTTISMPFKILLFVLADGWNLIIINLVQTFK